MNKPKVLFLCTGNSARSIMAEALLRHMAGDQFEVYSAGLEPKGINPYTVQVLTESGIDMTGQSSKEVTVYLGRLNPAYVITVCAHAEANCPTVFLTLGDHLHWYFDDPAAVVGDEATKLAAFRRVRDEIAARLGGWLAGRGKGDA